MRSRSFISAVGVVVLAAGLAWAVASPATAGPGPGPFPGVCQHRVCVLVLDAQADSDRDGVTDVDEVAAGTDPNDPWSFPGAPELIDLAIGGKLTSFNRHLTEVVILPTMTPDGKSLATGFGAFDMPAQAWLANDPRDGLAKIRENGYSNQIGAVTGMLQAHDKDRPPWGRAKDYSLVAGGAMDYGPNSGKFGTLVGGHRKEDGSRGPEVSFTGGDATYLFDMEYSDGSRDEVTTFGTKDGSGADTVQTGYTSYDADGNKIGYTTGSSTQTTDPKTGDTTSSDESDTTHFDPKTGAKTGSTSTSVQVTVHNGVKTTTTTKIYYDAEGNETGGDSTTVDETCTDETCDGGGYYNAEYIAPGPITGEDFARVITRINSSRTPGPDTGLGDATSNPPPLKWPLVSLINPDGVTVLAMSNTPTFNRAQPEYDPRLSELAPLAGIKPPVHNENGTTSWPSGEPKP